MTHADWIAAAESAWRKSRRAKGYVWKAYHAAMSWEALLAMVWEGP